jgi:hypothetical protein
VIKDAGPGFAQALQFLLTPPKPATRVGGIILLQKTKGVEGGKNRGITWRLNKREQVKNHWAAK